MAGSSAAVISPQYQPLGLRWFILQADWQRELALSKIAAERGAEVFMPVENREVRHARRVVDKSYPVISRYVFLRLDLEEHPWQDIGHHRYSLGWMGVRPGPDGVLRPAAVREKQMDQLLSHLSLVPDEEKDDIFPHLDEETRVRIHAGILKDFTGLVVTDDGGRTVIALDKKFGGKDVEVARESVRTA